MLHLPTLSPPRLGPGPALISLSCLFIPTLKLMNSQAEGMKVASPSSPGIALGHHTLTIPWPASSVLENGVADPSLAFKAQPQYHLLKKVCPDFLI